MHVVSDADVIIHLSKLHKLSLLKSLYVEIAIPEYIKSEISSKDNESIQNALDSYLKVFNVSKKKAEEIAENHNIHPGEAHVKALGEELKSSLLDKMKSGDFRIHPDILQKALLAIKEM